MASLILPTSTAIQMTALMNHSMSLEADVNGVWNTWAYRTSDQRLNLTHRYLWLTSIFHYWFPTGTSANTIKPEANFKGFINLLITHLIFQPTSIAMPWRVIYEGKSSTGDTFEHISTQLQQYTSTLALGKICYPVGARGKECMFWKYKKGDSNAMKGIKVERGVVQISEDGCFLVAKYDIVANAHKIQIILTYIQGYTLLWGGITCYTYRIFSQWTYYLSDCFVFLSILCHTLSGFPPSKHPPFSAMDVLHFSLLHTLMLLLVLLLFECMSPLPNCTAGCCTPHETYILVLSLYHCCDLAIYCNTVGSVGAYGSPNMGWSALA